MSVSLDKRSFAKIAAAAAVLASTLTAADLGHAEQNARRNFNLPVKTLGGSQLWVDTYIHAGWRIQRNVITGHSRLLDPEDVRRAWGSFAKCKATFARIRSETGLAVPNQHLVLLVHGIAPLPGPFGSMEAALGEAGFDATAISYPSTRGSIEDHAAGIARLLDTTDGSTKVSFVTHSMGGLVVRHLLAMDSAWKQRIKVGRIVQIAPPNQGAEMAGWVSRFRPYQLVFGRAGQGLSPRAAKSIPTLNYPFAIIAGGKGDEVGFNPLLSGDDDGVVRVSETALMYAQAHLLVRANHAMLVGHPQVIKATTQFLKHGMIRD